MEHTDRDTDAFFRVMWKGLRDVLEASLNTQLGILSKSSVSGVSSLSGTEFVNHLVKSVRRIKETKRLMKEIWEESKSYRISDRVHMTEIQVLQRLKNDGVFPWLDRNPRDSRFASNGGGMRMENLHLCFFMRRYLKLETK